ncbi:hypothetical protein ACFYQQ_01335 [Streptomyces sp. NPDC005496]|uniref:hypothetical protein n=1 Tax=unclassified Streptomyces TaxID=2593676 RepID=UPI0033AB8403
MDPQQQPPAPQRPALTALQQTRIEYARRDLDYARSEDLAQLEAGGLILIIERLRGRLDDVLNLVCEIHADAPGAAPDGPTIHHP